MTVLIVVLALANIAVASSGGATQTQPRWVITDLGVRGGSGSGAVAINEQGQVIAERYNEGTDVYRAYLWQQGTLTDLGTLGGKGSEPNDINDAGQIVGWSETKPKDGRGSSVQHAFLWENGKMRDLGTLGGPESEATAINERGQVVGWAETKRKGKNGSLLVHAFLWEKGRMRDLGTLGGPQSEALAINEHGVVVGRCDSAKVPRAEHEGQWMGRACRWRGGRVTNLDPGPLIGTEAPMDRVSRAEALNERGQILVNVQDGDGYSRAHLWQRGRRSPLSTAWQANAINERGQVVGDGDNGSACVRTPTVWEAEKTTYLAVIECGGALAITEQGLVAGWADDKNGNQHAATWQRGRRTDLGTLGGKDSSATAVNGSDQVVGWASTKDGSRHAALWMSGA